MSKLRKGDWWKALILVVLIAGVFYYIYYTLNRRTANASRSTPARRVETQRADSTARVDSAEMFTSRPGATASELEKAAVSEDPFRPEVPKRSGASRAAPTRSQSSQSTGEPVGLWLAGVITGKNRLAVIRDGDQHYFVQTGDQVGNGWTVSRIGNDSTVLTKNGRTTTLFLGIQPQRSSRSLPTW